MGVQEKEIVELYREMQAERGGAKITPDGLATLTAARILKRTMEKCAIEICEAIELKLTPQQANAVIHMDNHGYSKSQGWDELLTQAEAITGRKAYGTE